MREGNVDDSMKKNGIKCRRSLRLCVGREKVLMLEVV